MREPIPTGGFRLHWRDCAGYDRHADYPCLNDALDRAGAVYKHKQGTLTRLENWMGEDACPAHQLLPVAEIRARVLP